MLLVREVLHCRPGKVGALRDKFRALGAVIDRLGYRPFRLMTDVSGQRFWTLIAETESDSLDAFLEMEAAVMGEADAQAAMAGYHDLVIQGSREVYRIEE